jgi:hypothetical protein
MKYDEGLDGIMQRRTHHAPKADASVITMAFGAMLGVADTYRSGKTTQRFTVNDRDFRASYKSYAISIVSPPYGGELIATLPLRGVTPSEAQPLIEQAVRAIRTAAGLA